MKQYIKMAAIINALVLVLNLSACGNNKSSSAAKSLYEHGLEVVQFMAEMAQSEEYISAYTTDNEIKTVIENISVGDYTTPQSVYAISIIDENLTAMAGFNNLKNVSQKLKSFLMQRFLSSLTTQVNSIGGAVNLAATSVCTASKTFVNENVDKDVIYLYTYDNAVPVAVTFTIGEDHAVSANGVFLTYDKFTYGSADEIKSFFNGITFSDSAVVEVAEVLQEK